MLSILNSQCKCRCPCDAPDGCIARCELHVSCCARFTALSLFFLKRKEKRGRSDRLREWKMIKGGVKGKVFAHLLEEAETKNEEKRKRKSCDQVGLETK